MERSLEDVDMDITATAQVIDYLCKNLDGFLLERKEVVDRIFKENVDNIVEVKRVYFRTNRLVAYKERKAYVEVSE